MWNRYRQTAEFAEGKPWLLRFFDQIRFFPVSAEELVEWRRDFPLGRREIRIDQETFRLQDHRAFLAANRTAIEAFEARRQTAFDQERAEWERNGEFARAGALAETPATDLELPTISPPPGAELVEAPLGGSLWKMLAEPGMRVEVGTVIAVIEAMKAECNVASSSSGVVVAVYAKEGQAIAPGAPLIALEAD
jgi:urea carboxylase